jgi:hypothetical protein
MLEETLSEVPRGSITERTCKGLISEIDATKEPA